jgi:hypothetical protein
MVELIVNPILSEYKTNIPIYCILMQSFDILEVGELFL